MHVLCVPAQRLLGTPTPCAHVDISQGEARGFAVVTPPHGKNEILLVPTAQISGIDDPAILSPGSPNYWALAWQQRKFLEVLVGHPIGRDQVGLAINSQPGRTQDQLHIHIGCVQPEVRARLATYAPARARSMVEDQARAETTDLSRESHLWRHTRRRPVPSSR